MLYFDEKDKHSPADRYSSQSSITRRLITTKSMAAAVGREQRQLQIDALSPNSYLSCSLGEILSDSAVNHFVTMCPL